MPAIRTEPTPSGDELYKKAKAGVTAPKNKNEEYIKNKSHIFGPARKAKKQWQDAEKKFEADVRAANSTVGERCRNEQRAECDRLNVLWQKMWQEQQAEMTDLVEEYHDLKEEGAAEKKKKARMAKRAARE